MGAKLFTLVSILCLPLISSCAAMFTGSTDDVQVVPMHPDEAQDWVVRGGDKAVPLGGTLVGISKKTKELTLENQATGESMTLELPRKFQGGYVFMDILFTPGFGLVGLLIDGGSGAFYDLPASLTVDLRERKFIGYDDPVEDSEGEAAEASSPVTSG